MHDTETMGYSQQKRMSFQWPAFTFKERARTTNPFLTKSKKKADDRHVQRIRHKHGRRSYLSGGIGDDSQSLLEREPTRSKDKGLPLIYKYTSVCARRHKHINSSASAHLNATQIAVIKGRLWRIWMVGPEFFFLIYQCCFLAVFFARSGSIKRVLTQLTLPQRSCVGQPEGP